MTRRRRRRQLASTRTRDTLASRRGPAAVWAPVPGHGQLYGLAGRRGADAHLPKTDNMVHMQDAEATITARIICALPWDISGSELTVPVKLTKAEENDSGADSNQVSVKLLSTANYVLRKEDVCVVSSVDSVWLIAGSVSSGRVRSDLLPFFQ